MIFQEFKASFSCHGCVGKTKTRQWNVRFKLQHSRDKKTFRSRRITMRSKKLAEVYFRTRLEFFIFLILLGLLGFKKKMKKLLKRPWEKKPSTIKKYLKLIKSLKILLVHRFLCVEINCLDTIYFVAGGKKKVKQATLDELRKPPGDFQFYWLWNFPLRAKVEDSSVFVHAWRKKHRVINEPTPR